MTAQRAEKKAAKAAEKKSHLINTAWTVFSEHGYTNSSMDMVVARAGASKATLYNHFKSKEELLRSVLLTRSADMRHKAFRGFVCQEGFTASLFKFGMQYLDTMINTDMLEVYRLAMSEAKHLAFCNDYESYFVGNWRLVAQYLEANIPAEHFVADPWAATMQLRGLLEGDLIAQKLSGTKQSADDNELASAVHVALTSFFRIYAPERAAELDLMRQQSTTLCGARMVVAQ